MDVILEPGTTDSVVSQEFSVSKGQEVTILLYPVANLGSDTATLKMKAPDGSLNTTTDDNGNIVMSATRTSEVVVGVGVYVLDVPTRTGSWGIAKAG